MNREYYKWFSPRLRKDMELLVFGHAGTPVLLFPTRTARFYDYENWRVIDALADKINKGWLQAYCVDSVDSESFYCKCSHPSQRILRHMQYEQYILQEVIPLIRYKNNNDFITSAGCSLGGYHAVNIALRHPYIFKKTVGMSSRFDLSLAADKFTDLFDHYWDENIYYNTPTQFIPHLENQDILNAIRRMQIILAVGKEDPFLDNNLFLHEAFIHKNIPHSLYIWEGEAHRYSHWREMVKYYL